MNRVLLILLVCCSVFGVEHAVTYEFSGGRFGDNLLSYLHAKWISYHHGVELLYKPFQYSSDLALHAKESWMTNGEYRVRRRAGVSGIEGDLHSEYPILFICPYFPEDPVERAEDGHIFFNADWKDDGFRKAALEMIAPVKELRIIKPPQDSISIALHLRVGENYDDDEMRSRFPLKLPPLSFYIEAYKQVIGKLKGKKIYCYIFTDAEVPERLAKLFKEMTPPHESVQFGWRRGVNRQNFNVLDDFFSLFQFDILIRSQSNFSVIPSLLHDFAILCFPSSYSRKKGMVKIDKTEMVVDDFLLSRLLREK